MVHIRFASFRQRNFKVRLTAQNSLSFARRRISEVGAATIVVSWLLTTPSFSQPAYVPTPGPLSPGIVNGTVNYSLQQEVSCPTATINFTGFGGNINGWANNNYDPFQSSDAGLGNYGAAAGISVPFGNSALREFCKKYAKIKGEFEESRLRNELLNGQASLLKQCLYLQDLGIQMNLYPKVFMGGGPLSAFAGCQSLAIVLDPANRKPTIRLMPPPPEASTEPMTKPATPVFLVNPQK
jgi:hypothetical protein